MERIDIPLEKVTSTTIAGIGHSQPYSTMRIEFNTGKQYDYYDVSEEEYLSIKNDASIGSKLRAVVKDKEYKKL